MPQPDYDADESVEVTLTLSGQVMNDLADAHPAAVKNAERVRYAISRYLELNRAHAYSIEDSPGTHDSDGK